MSFILWKRRFSYVDSAAAGTPQVSSWMLVSPSSLLSRILTRAHFRCTYTCLFTAFKTPAIFVYLCIHHQAEKDTSDAVFSPLLFSVVSFWSSCAQQHGSSHQVSVFFSFLHFFSSSLVFISLLRFLGPRSVSGFSVCISFLFFFSFISSHQGEEQEEFFLFLSFFRVFLSSISAACLSSLLPSSFSSSSAPSLWSLLSPFLRFGHLALLGYFVVSFFSFRFLLSLSSSSIFKTQAQVLLLFPKEKKKASYLLASLSLYTCLSISIHVSVCPSWFSICIYIPSIFLLL